MFGKFKYLAAAIFVVAVIIIIILVMPSSPDKNNQPYVIINSVKISVEVAANDATREKGLSGRTSLAQDNGMLFVFDKPAIQTFWMPDMNFPIDIIWINNNKVVDISPNVSNEFDPQNPEFYEPNEPAQYVLEVNAGFSEKNNIKTGDTVSYEL